MHLLPKTSRNGEGDLNLGIILIIDLEIAVVLVILYVIEKSDPLLVFLIYHEGVVGKVLLEWHAD